jgi:hypothetical protein
MPETVTVKKPIGKLMIDIYDLYNKMEVNNIMLSFKGDITSELMTSILHIMESRLENLKEEPKVKKKVYNVLVECLQNLYHHIDEVPNEHVDKNNSGRSAIFMIGIGDNHYSIVTGNYMLTEKVSSFKERLESINSMSSDELKNLYKEILNNDQLSSKGGGGLGMIDIARKTGEKLNFNFVEINNKYSFFSLNIKVGHTQLQHN